MRVWHGKLISGGGAALVAACLMLQGASGAGEEKRTIEFTVVNVEYQGTKVWVPSTLVVHKGDTVKITLINNVPSEPPQHGFAIPDFNVQAVVNRGEPTSVEFVADKGGVFPIKCHLHPAHIGGQFVVQAPIFPIVPR